MISNPLVSIIIPCYNVANYINKAIQSILQQSYIHLEVLIIDDASTDDTLTKIRTVTDPRVRIIHFEKNTLKVGAVNIVLQQAKGDLITFQDADDWSEISRIQQQVDEFLKNPSLGICFTNYRFVGKKTFVPKRIALSDAELKDEFLEFGHKKHSSFTATNCPSMMITREVLAKTGGYHPYFAGRVAEDIQWIYRILKDFEGVTVDKVLYNYTIREGSITQNQLLGTNAKYAYSWQLLSKIIRKDIYENLDILAPENAEALKELELQACEEALTDQIRINNSIREAYENSMSFNIGKKILTPLKMFHAIKRVFSKN